MNRGRITRVRRARSGRRTVSGSISHTTPPSANPAAESSIALASPKRSAISPVTSGAVIEMMRPQLKIDAAVERRCGGYCSESHGPQMALHDNATPYTKPSRCSMATDTSANR